MRISDLSPDVCSSDLPEERAVAALHQPPAATDGAAHAVAQMVARVAPIGLDARLAEQREGDIPLGRIGKPAVKGLQDQAQAPPAVGIRQTRGWYAAKCREINEGLQGSQACGPQQRGTEEHTAELT